MPRSSMRSRTGSSAMGRLLRIGAASCPARGGVDRGSVARGGAEGKAPALARKGRAGGAPMFATRPPLYGTRHAVSAGHYLAAAAGFSVLEAGGNAIDAGCAAGIALGVLLPDLVNVAGVAPILIRKADGTVETIAGLGTWPKSIPADLFMRDHGGKIPNGVLRTVVPAAPDAWITALERHGTMGFGDVAQHALRHARDGFAVYPLLAQNIRDHQEDYARWPGNAA